MKMAGTLLAVGAGFLSVLGMHYLVINKNRKYNSCKSEKNEAKTEVPETVPEVCIEVPVQRQIISELVSQSETKLEKYKFYAVECLMGHVGRNNGLIKVLPIKAKTAKEAAEIARYKPRVKHDAKNAILSVTKVSFDRFIALERENQNDPFFHCTNRQMQREFEEQLEIFKIEEEEKLYTKKHSLRKIYNYREPGVERLRGDISTLDIA